jgi:hypothetical protein
MPNRGEFLKSVARISAGILTLGDRLNNLLGSRLA